MRLIIVRHGETDENVRQILTGTSDAPMNSTGRAQAQSVAARLRGEPIELAYVSDLVRARQTAEEILQFHPKARVIYARALRERDVGVFNGRPVQEIRDARAESGQSFYEYTPPQGESMKEVQRRIAAFFRMLWSRHGRHTVLLVTHGAVITNLLLHLFAKPYDEYAMHRPGNTAVTILDIDEGGHVVHALNCQAHLGAAKAMRNPEDFERTH